MNRQSLLPILSLLLACGEATTGDDGEVASDFGASSDQVICPDDAGTTVDAGGKPDASTTSDAGTRDGGVIPDAGTGACTAQPTQQARVACAANAVLATLTPAQRSGVAFQLTDYANRSKWNNLPIGLRPRAGTQLGSLSSATQTAVLDLMKTALSDDGQSTMTGILRADDYLKTMQGGYGSETYAIAIYGTPAATGDFEVMFGGHHMAYNLNFVGGKLYPVPNHVASEPQGEFTFQGATYAPMVARSGSMFAVYEALDATQRSSAYLTGQTFSDVIVNPGLDYGKGQSRTSKSAYPAGANRRGVLVSKLTAAQQALVTAAIEQWVRQVPGEAADEIMAAYTGAYADTYFAWGGNSAGADVERTGSYLRIDGPRVWIELSVQGGIVIRGKAHHHTIYRDKVYDYGGQL